VTTTFAFKRFSRAGSFNQSEPLADVGFDRKVLGVKSVGGGA